MSTNSQKAIRTFLTAVVFIASVFSFNVSANNTASTTTNKANKEVYCGVSDFQIVDYLWQFGYYVRRITPITGSCDVIVDVQDNKRVIVHIESGNIIGHEEWVG